MAINILDSTIFNRISAGEVVEKPASIVKELVDNSIDAGATDITIEIKNGGIDYIKVSDNGSGIEEEDIKKAFLPHATSKIKSLEDLDNIFTLGFRGEALASIVSVSQASMRTKTANAELASSIEVKGGEFSDVKKVASNTGTTIEVKNLFYNTPARRKFLRKPKMEENEITNVVSRFILANPSISFKYIVEDKIVYKTLGNDLVDAISCVYGMETTQNILPIDVRDNNIHIYGFVSKVAFTKPNTTYQTLLVNKRYVIDETVSKAVYMAYDEFLMSRQFPFFVLFIDMPFTDVDVNVHPNKLSIKFSKPNIIFDLIYNAVRRVIFDSIKPVNTQNYTEIKSDLPSIEEEEEVEIDSVIYPTPDFNANVITFRQSFGSNVSMFDKYSSNKFDNQVINDEKVEDICIKDEEQLSTNSSNTNNLNIGTIGSDEAVGLNTSYQAIQDFSDYKIIGEIFNEFIILEKQNVMLLVDFHAGHERLLYDKMINQMAERNVAIQDLLLPYVHAVSPKEMEHILNFKDDLERIGFSIDQFSNTEIKISSVPLLVKDINLKEFVDSLLNDINNYKPKISYGIDSYLMKTACRSAVKAGQTLNEMQIKHLLKDLDIKNPVLLCPHGRPIVSVVTRAQIEKWFKRIV